MFKASGSTRALVTLFHSPTSTTSKNLVSLIKTQYSNPATRNFDVEITESKPTRDQMQSLSLFFNNDQKLEENFAVRPILVDWFNGRVAINDESKSSTILEELQKLKNK